MRTVYLVLQSIILVCALGLPRHSVASEEAISFEGEIDIDAFEKSGALQSIATFIQFHQNRIFSSGSAFLLATPDQEFWVTADHTRTESTSLTSEIFTPHEISPFQSMTEYRSFLPKNQPIDNFAFSKDWLLPYSSAHLGTDLTYFPKQILEDYEDGPQNSHALSLRDLINNPMELGEKIYLLGMQFGRIRVLSCRWWGYSLRATKSDQLAFIANCPEADPVETSGQPIYFFNGLSGGVVLDVQYRAVGVIYSQLGTKNHQIWGQPLYYDQSRQSLQGTPLEKTIEGRALSYQYDCFSFKNQYAPQRKSTCEIQYVQGMGTVKFLVNGVQLKRNPEMQEREPERRGGCPPFDESESRSRMRLAQFIDDNKFICQDSSEASQDDEVYNIHFSKICRMEHMRVGTGFKVQIKSKKKKPQGMCGGGGYQIFINGDQYEFGAENPNSIG